MAIKQKIRDLMENPDEYEKAIHKIIQFLSFRDVKKVLELEELGVIKIPLDRANGITVLKLNDSNRDRVERLLKEHGKILFGGEELVEYYAKNIKKENLGAVSGFFNTILVEKRIKVDDFHPFVLELYGKYEKKIGEEIGASTVYGVIPKPTFMGEMLAKFILEGKAEGIDFNDKELPLKEMVAKEYFGRLWKQKMLFLDLLQKIRDEGKIPYKIIEKFVDKTFAKSEKRAFIIKAFVETAKNRGFELGEVNHYVKKEVGSFIQEIDANNKFKEELTESEIMQGVEGFSWDAPGNPGKSEKKAEKKKTITDKANKVNVNKVVELIGERKEITLPEVGKAVKEAGYKGRAGHAWNAGLIAGPVARIIRKIELLGIKITHKNELSDEEKSLILKKADGRDSIKRDEIKEWLMENGRVLEGYIGGAVDEGMRMLEEMGYCVEGKIKAPGREKRKLF